MSRGDERRGLRAVSLGIDSSAGGGPIVRLKLTGLRFEISGN